MSGTGTVVPAAMPNSNGPGLRSGSLTPSMSVPDVLDRCSTETVAGNAVGGSVTAVVTTLVWAS
jgi:hypothetical protein